MYTKDVVRRPPLRLNIVTIMEATFDMDENIVQLVYCSTWKNEVNYCC